MQQSLVKPPCKGLEDDDNEPPVEEPTGLDYSNPWHEQFVSNNDSIKSNLHLLHPCMQNLLELCSSSLGTITIVDCLRFRSVGPMDFEQLRNDIILDCEKSEEKLMQ